MNGYVVTEGEFDAELLRRLLAEEVQHGILLVSGRGKSGAKSLARSLVASRRRPVALVLDADTTDDGLVREQRLVSKELLDMASPGVPTEVFMAVPSMEALFFTDRELLGRLVGTPAPDEEWSAGQFVPKEALKRILGNTGARAHSLFDLLAGLTDTDTANLAKHPLISEIKEFLRKEALTEATVA